MHPDHESQYQDSFLDEVHRLKRAAAERAGYDLRRMFEQCKEIEKTLGDRLVRSPEEIRSEDDSDEIPKKGLRKAS